MSHAYHDLSCIDDLAGFDQRFHDDATGIGYQLGITCRVESNFSLGLGRTELGLGGIRRSLDLIVGRSRYRAGSAQVAVAGFILSRLLCPRSRSSDSFPLRMRCEPQIDGIDAHEWLAAFDGLSRVYKPLQHLAGDAKAQVALDSSSYGPGEGA